jgi:hypothetical protein
MIHRDAVCLPRQQLPHSHSWNCSFMIWRAWSWTSASSLASTVTTLECHLTTLVNFGDNIEEQILTSNISEAIWSCSSRRMVYIFVGDCLRIVQIHYQQDCSCIEAQRWPIAILVECLHYFGPPLWSSGQSSWLQIRRPWFDSWHYQKKSSWSGTGSTQPREYNWGATW